MEVRDATIDELVAAVRAGDHGAFARLYERFHRAVHAVVIARVAARDAGDVVQDVFADAWRNVGKLRDPAAFPGWLLAIARNRARDVARRRHASGDELAAGRAPDRATDLAADLAIAPPPRAEAVAALRALRELPDTYRDALAMRLIEGLTGPEIAELTGMTADSVRVHLHRGMKLLRERLDGEGPRR